jgi:putative ABC transport system permease protein
MIQIKNLKKIYGDQKSEKVVALKGINLDFRENEFISILGPSGCGKTTFLNIIGGLDKYTSGDLIINGKSTKEYKDRDWDTYRNHSVGFVFQSYNLISHQSILSNVELALTLAGISKKDRRKRAIETLKTVGLGEKIYKKPTELSGGQMQRVAIARALIGNPDILLADEPTGALDSETSTQIMELLKKVSKDRLVVMVTHNQELAEKYSTRIIKLLDGEVIDDSNPYHVNKKRISEETKENKRTHMTYRTALSLSFKNLMTKKGRTILTAFAGSIGIIGIALILALSNGIEEYINNVEEDTLSQYPIQIKEESVDISSMMQSMMGNKTTSKNRKANKIYSSNIMNDMLTTLSQKSSSNNLTELKKYLDKDNNAIKQNSNDIQYEYNLSLNLYKEDTSNGVVQVNPSTVMDSFGMSDTYNSAKNSSASSIISNGPAGIIMSNTDVWTELLNNTELLKSQYNLVAGSWPKNYNEVVIMVDKDGNVSDYTFYTLGLKDQKEIKEKFQKILNGEKLKNEKIDSYSYDELLNLKFKLVLNTDYYEKQNGVWINNQDNTKFMKNLIANSETIKVVGIVEQDKNAVASSPTGGIGYLKSLKEYVIKKSNESQIVTEQKKTPTINVLSGLPFPTSDNEIFDASKLTTKQKQALSQMTTEELAKVMEAYNKNASSSYESNLQTLGAVDLSEPTTINIYPKDFKAKDAIEDAIKKYNKEQKKNGKDANVINYTDVVGVMISSVKKIVDIISYVLTAFVSISLVVSSIMISIITYISVLERTKEIGILRSIGASKKDVSRVFNAETMIEGLAAGVLGIGITILLSLPINKILYAKLNVPNIALLPVKGAIVLIILSVILTVVAGLIPSRMAAKKDPAVALRTE